MKRRKKGKRKQQDIRQIKSGRPADGNDSTLGTALAPNQRSALASLRDALEKKERDKMNVKLTSSTRNNHGSSRLKSYKNTLQTTQDTVSKKNYGTKKDDDFDFWTTPLDMVVREKPPKFVLTEAADKFGMIVSANKTAMQSVDGDDLLIIVGIDFGTSSTKIVARMPYETGAPCVAIPAPQHIRSEDHPYLWQTAIWINTPGEYFAYPEAGANLRYTLKQDLMGIDLPDAGALDTLEASDWKKIESSVAHLTYVIRYVRGWLVKHKPSLIRGRKLAWFVNLGMPAASYDNRILSKIYQTVANAAIKLADSAGQAITRDAVQFSLRHEAVRTAAGASEEGRKLGVSIIPEFAAAATAYAKTAGSDAELYALVDVGALTLDVCTFRLHRKKVDKFTLGQDQYGIFESDVRPLGVEAFHWFRDRGKTEKEIRQQCQRSIKNVIWETKKKRDPNSSRWKAGNELPVFLTGGGSHNDFHRRIVKDLGPWLKYNTENTGIRTVNLPKPAAAAIDLPEDIDDLSRMTVAWGLSNLPDEIGKIIPKREIDDVAQPKPRDTSASYVSKDQI